MKSSRFVSLLSALVCVTLASPNAALAMDAGATSQLPPFGEPKSFRLPEIETYSLRNGMRVTLVPFGNVPKVTLRASVMVGNLNDGETPWISDLTVDMLKEGAGDLSGPELAVKAASFGGDLNVSVSLDQTTVAMDVLSEAAVDAVGLIADVLQAPSFPADEFERVKSSRLRDLSVAASQPGTIATAAFNNIVYPDHPYSAAVLPDAEIVEALTLEQISAFHADNFGAARTHLFVVGKFDQRAMKRAIRKSFRKWEKGPARLSLPPAETDGAQIVLIDRPDAVQSTLRLGKRVPPISDDVSIATANTMLGGYFSSRITKNIREDKGYTYSPRSTVSNENSASYWAQSADVTSEATGASLVEIVKEVRDLVDNPPSIDELTGVQNYMNGIFVIRLASRGGVATRLAFLDLHGFDTDYLESYVARVREQTPQSVHQAAKEHLQIDDLSLVVAGDLKSVRPQLEQTPAFADRLPPTE